MRHLYQLDRYIRAMTPSIHFTILLLVSLTLSLHIPTSLSQSSTPAATGTISSLFSTDPTPLSIAPTQKNQYTSPPLFPSTTQQIPVTSESTNEVQVHDSTKEVIDYKSPFLDQISFPLTEQQSNGQAEVDKILRKHHNNSEVYEYLRNLHIRYPDITRLYKVGESVEKQELWVLEITEEPGKHKLMKPEFRYIANMHGNEVVGREILLHLARLLVENYEASKSEPAGDTRPTAAKFVRKLLRDTRIHLMPSMNPDGYDRSEVACRYEVPSKRGRLNVHNVDLNRNFPDNMIKNIADAATQPETLAIMAWSKNEPFVLSANLHGGALVASYPYDSNSADLVPKNESRLTPDDDVFKMLALTYSYVSTTQTQSRHLHSSD